jgi:argininosuccinate lyase
MPQKRNPVALEHARGLGSQAAGQAQAIMTAVHNTPFGDIVDTEDDLQPLVASMFRDATRMITIVAASLEDAQFNVERLAARAGEGGTTITELADTLARDHGLPFGTAHKIAGMVIRARDDAPAASVSQLLAKASADVLGAPITYDDAAVEDILSPRHFVEIRTTLGGPAPERTTEAISASRAALAADDAWWKGRQESLARAAAALKAEARRL